MNSNLEQFVASVNARLAKLETTARQLISLDRGIPAGTAWPSGGTIPTGYLFERVDLLQVGLYTGSAWATVPFGAAANAAILVGTSAGGIASSNSQLNATDNGLELGILNPGSTAAYIDFHGVSPATDYEARILRNTGANGVFQLVQTGTGDLQIESTNAGAISLQTNSAERIRINSNGQTTATGLYLQITDTGANNPPAAGSGLELLATGGTAYVQAYNRSGSAWLPLQINALQTVFGGPATQLVGINGAPSYPLDIVGSAGSGWAAGAGRVIANVGDVGFHLFCQASSGQDWVLFSSGGASGLGAGRFTIGNASTGHAMLQFDSSGGIYLPTAPTTTTA